MHLLENAVQSIQNGLEDYATGSSRRALSAIRNIHAGVLLLLKEKLYQISPSDSDGVLIKANFDPEIDNKGNVTFVGSEQGGTGQIRKRERKKTRTELRSPMQED